MAETLSGCLLSFIQNETTPTLGGCLLSFVQNETQSVSGCLLSFIQNETQSVSGCLLSFRQREFMPPEKWQFNGIMGKEPYNISVFIDGVEIDTCQLKDTIEISLAVNQAKTAKLTIKANCDNNNQIDLYKYAGKIIEIYYLSKTRYILLYRGMVAIQKIDIDNKHFVLTCTDEKINRINDLTENQLNNIGYYSEYLFNEELTKEQVFSKRMESTPSDYYFDNNGNFTLTAWQPKNTPDLIIEQCPIFANSFSYSVLNLGEIVNKIKVLFQFNYNRQIQRDLRMEYNPMYSGTLFVDFIRFVGTHKFIPVPPVNSVITASNSAGWVVGDFRYSTIPSLANTGVVIYNKDDYAMYASWIASKRWLQNVQEENTVTLKNADSIAFFGEKSEEINFSMRFKNDENSSNWANDYQCYFSPNGIQAENGDWIIDLSGGKQQDYNKAMLYALNVAKTKMLNSHFGNECSFDYVLLPEIELKHTIGVNTAALQGNLRVQSITHTLDFKKRLGVSKITAKWFKGFSGDSIYIPQRPAVPVAQMANAQTRFGNIVLKKYSAGTPQGAVIVGDSIKPSDYCISKDGLDNLYGYVMEELILNQVVAATVGKVSAVKFAVKTPEIEKQSTDAVTVASENEQNISIPNNEINTYLPCRNRG